MSSTLTGSFFINIYINLKDTVFSEASNHKFSYKVFIHWCDVILFLQDLIKFLYLGLTLTISTGLNKVFIPWADVILFFTGLLNLEGHTWPC